MLGQHGGNHDRVFYSLNLNESASADHLLRGIDRFLDLATLCRHLAMLHSHTGRPSLDSELIVRFVPVGYSFAIRFEQRLCEEDDRHIIV
jgi:transposase